MEDLVTLKPTPRLKIELSGTGSLQPEEVFKLFRPFGVIVSLTTEKNTAIVTYAQRKSAIRFPSSNNPLSIESFCFSARNCLHNYILVPKPVATPTTAAPTPPLPDQPAGRIRISYGDWQRFVQLFPLVLYAIVLIFPLETCTYDLGVDEVAKNHSLCNFGSRAAAPHDDRAVPFDQRGSDAHFELERRGRSLTTRHCKRRRVDCKYHLYLFRFFQRSNAIFLFCFST